MIWRLLFLNVIEDSTVEFALQVQANRVKLIYLIERQLFLLRACESFITIYLSRTRSSGYG